MKNENGFSWGVDGHYTHGIEGYLFIGLGYDSHPDEMIEGNIEDLVEFVTSQRAIDMAHFNVLTVSLDLGEEEYDPDDVVEIIARFEEAGVDIEITN